MLKAIPEAIHQDIVRKIPMGRLGKPEEIAWVAAFLISEESAYITGSNIAYRHEWRFVYALGTSQSQPPWPLRGAQKKMLTRDRPWYIVHCSNIALHKKVT